MSPDRSRLRLGIIGINGQGNYNLTNVAHENIVALCDVDETRSAGTRKKFPKAQFMITGVLGPNSNAHGPNEFLHIPYARKLTSCVAQSIVDHFRRAQSAPR